MTPYYTLCDDDCMTTTQNIPAHKITFRIAKRFGSGAGSKTVWTAVLDGKATSVLVRREDFDFANRCEQFSIIDRRFADQRFISKRAAAAAALGVTL